MTHLLSNQSLVDLMSQLPAIVEVVHGVGYENVHASALTVGQVQSNINALPMSNPDREVFMRNLRTITSKIRAEHELLPIDRETVEQWVPIQAIKLHDAGGRDIGFASRMTIAVALQYNFKLITRDVPWVSVMRRHGLGVVAYRY